MLVSSPPPGSPLRPSPPPHGVSIESQSFPQRIPRNAEAEESGFIALLFKREIDVPPSSYFRPFSCNERGEDDIPPSPITSIFRRPRSHWGTIKIAGRFFYPSVTKRERLLFLFY